MIRLLHLADVHLGASFSAFGALADARAAAVLDAFRRMSERADDEEADAVVVAGDLLDGPRPSPEVDAAVRDTLRRVVESGRPVFLIPGNHDALTLRPDLYRDLPDGAHLFTEPAFGAPVSVETSAGPLHVYGIAFDRAREPEPLGTFERTEAPGVHVVLLHGSVPDAPHWGTSPNALRLPLAVLSGLDADYIALGDYHRFRPPAEFDADGGIPACYSGSFAALDLTETGPRGYAVAELEPGRPPEVAHRPSGVTPVEDVGAVDIGGCESAAQAADAVADRVPEGAVPVARLEGTPGFPLDADAVRTHLEARFGHAGLTDESRFYASDRLDELAERDTVVGHVVRLGRRRIEAAADDGERAAEERALAIALGALEVE